MAYLYLRPTVEDDVAPEKFDNSGDRPLYVPGFGCRFDFQLNSEKRFVHGVEDAAYEIITARELAMLQLMNQLTDNPNWQKKVYDDDIITKWKDEAKCMALISEKAFRWCITELRDKVSEGEGLFTVTLDAGARCVKADGLISEQLHYDINAAVQSLLDAPVRDWDPGSDEQVLNLVHPSMYPLVYGKTRVIRSGQVKLDDILEPRDDTFIAPLLPIPCRMEYRPGAQARRVIDIKLGWSVNYQWLPCDVAFVGCKGSEVRVTSYINNLPYRGQEILYGCVEKLITASIPLWNEVLETDCGYHEHARTNLRIPTRGADESDLDDKKWIERLPDLGEDNDKEEWEKAVQEVTEYLKKPDRPENLALLHSKGVSSQDELPLDWPTKWGPYNAAEWKFDRIRRVMHPEPFFNCTYEDWKQGKARPFAAPYGFPNTTNCPPHIKYKISIQDSFRQQGLQVIVKLAGIELTPKKPTYEGSNWHLEGMLNDHIVATAVYYFDVQNVTESRIRFRQNTNLDNMEFGYDRGDLLPLEMIFDVDDLHDGKQMQEIGSVVTTQGRLLVFPNTRQHRVDPFELIDRTKPGHRRFIVLWLVDPHYRVLSTKNVPPQQFSWWKKKMFESIPPDIYLAAEIQGLINEELKRDTMTREQAESYRLKLMNERTRATEDIYRHTERFGL